MHALPLALLLVTSQTPAPAAPPAAAAAAVPVAPFGPPSPQAIEKMGQGDRAFLERDYRNALFAYMDAAYLAPPSAAPRVKMARAYLALRYPDRAIEQAERALAMDPGNAEARKVIDEARAAGPQGAPPAGNGRSAAKPAAAQPSQRVYKYPAAAPAAPVAAPPAAPPRPAPAAVAVAAPPAPGASASDRYRAGIDLLQKREFDKAVAAFTEAVTIDPKFAVAYSARASARFGLGAYREAADDYRAAIDLGTKLATPLYGLAECYRVLGQPKEAAEMYGRYAESKAPDVREDLRAAAAKRAQELK